MRHAHKRILAALAVGLSLFSRASYGQSSGETSGDMFDLALEDVLNIKVTIASRTPEQIASLPAAVSVVTQEDIRRSGVTTLAEAMRLVPGMHVSRIDSNRWAVSVRGFNSLFANKLLVLIDGRSVYTPLFSGVYWDVQDTVLEDVDRIEVIRGPGASVWGANAVNGVINIVTKSAKEAQGALVVAGGGNYEQGFTSVRYGSQLSKNVFFKAYTKLFNREAFPRASSGDNHDQWDAARGGFRVDAEVGDRDSVTVDSSFYSGDEGLEGDFPDVRTPPYMIRRAKETDFYGGHVLARWQRSNGPGADTQVQTYYDVASRDDLLFQTIHTWDIDFNQSVTPWAGHQLVWGGNYRLVSDETAPALNVSFDPSERTTHLFGGFVQDEIELIADRIKAMIGTKIEHNDFTGWEVQPSARLIMKPAVDHSSWISVSRAVRVPSRTSDDVRADLTAFQTALGFPAVARIRGSRDTEAEELTAFEIGHRYKATPTLSFDLATFWNEYEKLVTFEPGEPFLESFLPPYAVVPLVTASNNNASAYGAELTVDWNWSKGSRVQGGYSYIHIDPDPDPDTRDPTAGKIDDPEHQVFVRSLMDLGRGFEFDSMVRYVDKISAEAAPAYTELDVRLGWRLRETLELSLVGQNLLHDGHREFRSDFTALAQTDIPRAFYGKVVWRFG